MALMTETNTAAMAARVLKAARAAGLAQRRSTRLQADFEHGQWWVTNMRTGEQWGAHDASGPGSFDGFSFEQVTNGDDE